MNSEFLFIVLIFILLIIFILAKLQYEKKLRKEVITFFTNHGYTQSKTKKLEFYSRESKIKYEVEKYYRGAGKTRKSYYRISSFVPCEKIFNFMVTKRGGLSKLFGVNKGVLEELNEDFNITSTNPTQIQLLFSPSLIDQLNILFRSSSSLSVNSQDGLLVIEVDLRFNNSRLFNSVEFMEFLNKQLLLSDILEGIEFEEYRCFNCNEEISLIGDFCSKCGVVAPKCVICMNDPEPDESIIQFDCCKSYAHKQHAATWIRKQNQCPSCRAQQPLMNPIREID